MSNDKMVTQYGEVHTPICESCVNRSVEDPFRCLAFPKGIPDEILTGKNDHSKPFKGDHGIRYEKGEPSA